MLSTLNSRIIYITIKLLFMMKPRLFKRGEYQYDRVKSWIESYIISHYIQIINISTNYKSILMNTETTLTKKIIVVVVVVVVVVVPTLAMVSSILQVW